MCKFQKDYLDGKKIESYPAKMEQRQQQLKLMYHRNLKILEKIENINLFSTGPAEIMGQPLVDHSLPKNVLKKIPSDIEIKGQILASENRMGVRIRSRNYQG